MNIFKEGFGVPGGLATKWNLSGGVRPTQLSLSTTVGRADSFSGTMNGAAAVDDFLISNQFSANYSTLYCGAAFNLVGSGNMFSGNSGSAFLFGLYDVTANGFQINVYFSANAGQGQGPFSLLVKRGGSGGTTLGTSSPVFTINGWHYIELMATIHPSAGAIILKMDGATLLNLTSQNTRNTANSFVNAIALGMGLGGNSYTAGYVDDIVINDPSGSYNNTFPGDSKVIAGLATGNGSSTAFTQNIAAWPGAATVVAIGTTILDSNSNVQRCTAVTGDAKTGASAPTWSSTLNATTTDNHVTWTCLGSQAAYKLINEQTPDGDFSYLSDATVNDQQTFTFPALTGNTVTAYSYYAQARKDDAGTRAIRLVEKSGATVADNGADFALSSGYQIFRGDFETDPATGSPMTVSAYNSSEGGVKITI